MRRSPGPVRARLGDAGPRETSRGLPFDGPAGGRQVHGRPSTMSWGGEGSTMPRPDRLRDALVSLVLAVVPAACLAALSGPSQPRPDPPAGGCPLVHCPGDA